MQVVSALLSVRGCQGVAKSQVVPGERNLNDTVNLGRPAACHLDERDEDDGDGDDAGDTGDAGDATGVGVAQQF